MPVDASIALGVKPMPIESPINQMAKMYEMQNAVQSNQLNQMKLQDLQRANERQTKWDEGVAGLDPSLPDYATNRLRLFAAQGPEGLKQLSSILKEESAAKGEDVKTTAAKFEGARKNYSDFTATLGSLANDPTLTKEKAVAAADRLALMGIIPQSLADNARQLPDDSAALRASLIGMTKSQLSPKDMIEVFAPKPVERATNTYKEIYDENPNSPTFGKVIPNTRIEMGVSPNTTATINAAAEQGRLNRAAKLKAEIDSGVTGLSPESLDFTAQLYMQTGMLPPLGMGAKAATLRKQIIERAAQLSMHPETAGAVNPAAPGATTPPVAPPVSAADAAGNVTQNKQNVAVAVKTLKDFSTGVQGQMVTSFNTALNHLDTLERLGNDLNNSDIKVVNRAANLFAKELGVAAPTSFDAAKKIVGAEIQKAIVRAGGTGSEREEAAAAFDAANSPAQLAGVFRSVKELLGGQLVSLKQQYDSNAGPKAKPFANKLNSAARKQLEALTGGKTSAAPTVGASPHANKSDAQIRAELGL